MARHGSAAAPHRIPMVRIPEICLCNAVLSLIQADGGNLQLALA